MAGDYTIKMQKEGFEDASVSVSVTEGEVVDLGEVQLNQEGEVGDQTLILLGVGIALAVVALAVAAIWMRRR